ncbi:MAG: hypothetical protein RL227_1654, partial [Pseudomonadota bacterium]
MIAVPTIKDELSEVARSNQIAPVLQDFDESKGVAGRVNSITSSGSPLMETARTRAAQTTAKRGLMNSSIGTQAGEQAVIETATPIANADASLFQQQRLTNQTAANNAATVNANNNIQAATTGRQMDLSDTQQQRSLMEQARQFDGTKSENARQFDATTSQRMDLAKLDVGSRKELANIEAAFKNQIQNNTNISQAWGTLQEAISKIQNNPELDPATKAQLIQNNLDSFKSFSTFWGKATGGAVDVSDLLNFGLENAGGGAGGGGSAPPSGVPSD